ncbi:cytochrome P450 67 [Mucidula mucida]|nr:cytochrome P450 67 [Mucidula mucida]
MFAQPFLTSLLTGISWPIFTALVSLDIERHPWVTVILTCTGFVTALRLFVPGIKVLEILLSFALFNVGLFSTFAVYRISPLHPLSKFPGPRGARISSWWITRHILKTDFNWFRSVEGMHHTWGDFVRVGPRELSINNASAIPHIYGPHSKCMKGPFYASMSTDPKMLALQTTQDVDDHRRRRKAWDRAFSTASLNEFLPRLTAKTDTLISQLRGQSVVDMTQWTMFWSFDFMGDIGLGKDFHSMETGVLHHSLSNLHNTLKMMTIFGSVSWFLRMTMRVVGPMVMNFDKFMEYSKQQLMKKEEEVDKDHKPTDVLSWLLKAKFENDRSAAPGPMAMHADAGIIIFAGSLTKRTSDTSATALTNAFYEIARNKAICQKLQSELLAAFNGAEWSYPPLKDVHYLDWVIDETLRLHPPVPSGLTRVTPPEGLNINGTFVPGGTIVSVPPWTIHKDERYWDNPMTFDPERWEKEGNPETREAFIPFSKGQWSCIGKTLARMEMRTVISKLVMNFDIELADEEVERTFERDTKDMFTLYLPELRLRLVPIN